LPYKDLQQRRKAVRESTAKGRANGKWEPPAQKIFVGIDGESRNGEYFLFQDSTGLRIDKHPVTIHDILPSICRRRIEGKIPINVMYGSFFDWNELFAYEPKEIQRAIFKRGQSVDIDGYNVKIIPRKFTSIRPPGCPYWHPYYFWDVGGFFQGRFDNILQDWNKKGMIGPIDPVIVEGKKLRGDNFEGWTTEKIAEYNLAECKALVELMNAFRSSLKIAGYERLKKWSGAGCLADLLMDECNAQTAIKGDFSWDIFGRNEKEDGLLNRIANATGLYGDYRRRMGYYGGRICLLQRGSFDNVYNYDLTSAYPTAITHLPGLNTAVWKSFKDFSERDLENYDMGLAEVEWKSQADTVLGPFPFRTDGYDHAKNEVIFPTYRNKGNGLLKGIYHLVEIKEAIRKNLWNIRLTGNAWVIEQAKDYPFKRFSELLDLRAKWSAENNPGNIPYKLAMNSGYGKTAQKLGKREYHEFFYAGYITAWTRAQLLKYVKQYSAVLLCTDGVYSTEKLDCPVSDKWGEWKLEEGPGDFIQAGFYRFKTKTKTRGYPKDSFDFDEVYAKVQKDGTCQVKDNIYVGIRKSLAQNKKYPRSGFYKYPKIVNWNNNSNRYMWYGQESLPVTTEQQTSEPYALDEPEEMRLAEMERETYDSANA